MANMWKNSTKKSKQNEETNMEQNQQLKQTPLGGFLVVQTTIKIWVKLFTKTSCDMSNTKGYLLNNWFWRCYTNNTTHICLISLDRSTWPTWFSRLNRMKRMEKQWILWNRFCLINKAVIAGACDAIPICEISLCVSSCSYFQSNSSGRRNSETVSKTSSVW